MQAPKTKPAILVVDDTPTNINLLLEYLGQQGFKVLVAIDGESAIEQAEFAKPDLILLDVIMPGINGFEACKMLKKNAATRSIPVIFMTALSETVDKVRGFEVGAVDYVTKPLQHEEVLARVTAHLTIQNLQRELQAANERLEQRVTERTAELSAANDALKNEIAERIRIEQALQESNEQIKKLKDRLQAENIYLQEEIKTEYNFEEIVGSSAAMKKVFQRIAQVANTDTTVLITGETGTGKELVARAIHNRSSRRERPPIKVNCAALPAALVESELFGHEKGAFTGATSRKIGRFELADGGTIFLDEIGDVPLDVQVKLLRVLQEQEFERIGGTQTIKVDVRLIAATNRDLAKAVSGNAFRADLFYRLNVFPIQVPPLHDRREDIPLLVQHFVNKFKLKISKEINEISDETMQSLIEYHWPGNVRELASVIERAVVMSSGPILRIDREIFLANPAPVNNSAEPASLDDIERQHILKILNQTRWIIDGPKGAAKILGLHPNTLRHRLQKLGIQRPIHHIS
jgi:DNA-binding NtrC family response regulator